MKKYRKLIFSILGVLLVVVIFLGYQIYKNVAGAEELTGKKGDIPTAIKVLPELTRGTADWPNWRGPSFDGKSSFTGLQTDWSKGLTKIWQVDYLCQGKANSSWSAPVVQGNRLVITGRDDNNDLIFCLDAESGKLIWKSTYPSEAETSHGPGARATAFIDEDRVYTFGRSGDLACWALLDGKMIWKKNVKDLGGKEPQWGYSTSPLVFQDKIIVQAGGQALVIAYQKMTGEVLWKSKEGDAGYAASVIMNINDQPRLLIYHGKGICMLDITTGKEFWNLPWVTDYCVNATTPVIDKNMIFHTSGYGMGCQVIEVNGDAAKVKWKSDVIASQHSDPILIDGYLYGYSGESNGRNGEFKCVEMATGKEKWTTKDICWGTIVLTDGHLICFDVKGNLYLVRPDPAKFILEGEIKKAMEDVTNPAWTAPIVANGKLYLRYLQRLICYDISKTK